jgi:hypothetical protein
LVTVQIEKQLTINGEVENGCRDCQQKTENQVSLVLREQACAAYEAGPVCGIQLNRIHVALTTSSPFVSRVSS